MTTLKDLQSSAGEMGETQHTTTVYKSELNGRVTKRKPMVKKGQVKSEHKRHMGDSMVKWEKVLLSKSLCSHLS